MGLSHAINRQEIIDVVYVGQGEPLQISPQKGSGFYNEQLAKQYTEYDGDLANKYLDEAGYAERDNDGWRLGPDGQYTRVDEAGDGFSTHEYFMTNPSLSGRGQALQGGQPVPQLVLDATDPSHAT